MLLATECSPAGSHTGGCGWGGAVGGCCRVLQPMRPYQCHAFDICLCCVKDHKLKWWIALVCCCGRCAPGSFSRRRCIPAVAQKI